MGGSPILELFAKLTLDDKEFNDKTNDAKSKWSGFASFLGKTGKFMAGAFAATTAATVALGKGAVDAYKNYEQLAGGIQKLFGEESAGIVMDYAKEAFMTSGKSMNDYMNSVSQISASLKRSIGDDMQEVARVADVAMQVISDNVNTFGSDAEFVENAIMGLSRNNYTMIDNLKLGYAGSAEGMRQLINDSGVLGYTLNSTSELATVGFDKMILAIEEIQKQNGIAGTTAKEALTTIEGAANATRAAWENVITAIGKGEGIQESLEGLSKAIFGVGLLDGKETGLLNQITKRVKKVMEGIGDFVVQAAPFITEKIPKLIIDLVPSILKSASIMFENVLAAIPSLFSSVKDLIMNEGLELIQSLSEGLVQGIPTLLNNALPMLLSFTEELRKDFGTIVDAGLELIVNLVKGIVAGLPQLIKYVPLIVQNIAGLINDNMPKIFATAVEIIITLGKGIIESIPVIIQNAGEIVKAIISVIAAINWLDLGSKIITSIGKGIKAFAKAPLNEMKNIINSVSNAFKNFSWSGLGRDIINGIVNGIRNFGGIIGSTLMDIAKGAWKGVKKFFGISSPSKLMEDTIGKFIPLGIAEGIEKNAKSVYDEMDKIGSGTIDAYNSAYNSSNFTPELGSTKSVNYGGLTFNIYGAEGQDPEDIARAVRDVIINEEERNRLVYA